MHFVFVSFLCLIFMSSSITFHSLKRYFKMFIVALLALFAEQHENAETRTQTNYIDHYWIWSPPYKMVMIRLGSAYVDLPIWPFDFKLQCGNNKQDISQQTSIIFVCIATCIVFCF